MPPPDRRPEAPPRRRSGRATLARSALMAILAVGCADGGGPEGTSFTVSPESWSLAVGETVELTARDAPGPVTWSSSDSEVATVVPETGFTRGVGPGTALVSAVSGGAVASAEITVLAPPSIVLSPPEVDFETGVGEALPSSRSVAVKNGGDVGLSGLSVGPVEYAANQPDGWLTVTLSEPVAPAVLTLEVTGPALDRGVYVASVPVRADGVANSPQAVLVTFSVLAPARIGFSREWVPMAALVDSTVMETVEVTNAGDRPLTGLAVGVTYPPGSTTGWLAATLDGAEAPATLTLAADGSVPGLGTHDATVTVSSAVDGVPDRDVGVEFTVSPGPAIRLGRTAVTIPATVGGDDPPPDSVEVTNAGGGTLSGLGLDPVRYAAGEPTGWLSPSLTAAEAPAHVVLRAGVGALQQGSYSATVPVTSPVADNSPVDLEVTLVVEPPPAIALSRSAVSFSTFEGGDDPAVQSVGVTNSGGGTLSDLSASVSYTGGGASGWLSTGWASSGSDPTTAPTTLRLMAEASGLSRGTYTATVTVSTSISGVASETISVTFVVESFEVDVLPLLQTDRGLSSTPCTQCHYTGGQPPYFDRSASTVHGDLLQCCVTANDLAGSSLWDRITQNSQMLLPSADQQTVREWILSGAPFN